ncbi:hypothetical protein E1A91_A11G217100v1 [Gossypium mustelinum]|uniref:Serine hydroxymethyltransferase-like domain-containing protein n=1 Tax=Gossypium mustelinum TaxID=34275 RepID=A0A5D2XA44_GOSMU|nr:hypothetical protein E1A91_A11G217100v1 [Gossypium mustelinum]
MFGWVYWLCQYTPNRWAPLNPHLICCLVGCITITSQICSFPNTPGPGWVSFIFAAVYTGLLLPGDRIMGLDTPSGGNTSHGYYTPHGRKVSSASIFFESLPYKVNPQTGALDFRPKILICGGSSYSREWDYGRFRQIADKCGAVLLCDMAQISGLIAAKRKGC